MGCVAFSCELPIEVVPSQSVRHRVIGKFVQTYQPAKVVQFKKTVRALVEDKLPAWWKPLEDCALEVSFIYTFPYTKTMLKSKKFPVYKITKPDIDNCGKALQDALTGLVWKDDNIIAERHSKKLYGMYPSIRILVEKL